MRCCESEAIPRVPADKMVTKCNVAANDVQENELDPRKIGEKKTRNKRAREAVMIHQESSSYFPGQNK